VDGVKSAEESVLSGVPQGTVLGPLINDLPSRVNIDTRCRLFADDCLLYRITVGLEDQVQLQSDLRELEQWAADWGMQFNPTKCHVGLVSANKRSHHHQYFYELCGVVLKSVESEKYLGVTIQRSVMEFPYHRNLHESKPETWIHQEEPERYTSRVETSGLCRVCQVRYGICIARIIWDPHFIKDSDALDRVDSILLMISYWWFFGTKPLSPIVFETFVSKHV